MGLNIEVGDLVVYKGIPGVLYYAIVDRVSTGLTYGRWSSEIERARQKDGTHVPLASKYVYILEKANVNLEEILWD